MCDVVIFVCIIGHFIDMGLESCLVDRDESSR